MWGGLKCGDVCLHTSLSTGGNCCEEFRVEGNCCGLCFNLSIKAFIVWKIARNSLNVAHTSQNVFAFV